MVQLFCNVPIKLPVLVGGSDTTVDKSNKPIPLWRLQSICQVPTWACLSFQTIQISGGGVGGGRGATVVNSTSSKVDLGVWNCRMATTKGITDSLLKKIPYSTANNKFCFTVDLANPKTVESRLTLMQQALVRFLIDAPGGGEKNLQDIFVRKWNGKSIVAFE
jgi:hypothetical protein